MIESFEAIYDAAASARAERVFYVRSLLQLRRFSTFAPPITCLVVVAAGLALGAPEYYIRFFAALLGLSLLIPLVFYILRPLSAKRMALKNPVRTIKLTAEAIQVSTGERTANIPWERIKHFWDAGDYVLLVFGKFASFGIPKASLPAGAEEFIRACVQRRGDAAGH